MTTIAYIRVSTDDQVDYSPDAQRNRSLQYAMSHDLGSVTFLSDEGMSGKNLDRPAMRQLIALVEAGAVQNVVVWRLDRLTRDTGDLNWLVKLFEKHCVSLHSVNEGQVELSTASGRLQAGIHGVLAQYYRDSLVENVKMGMEQAALKGEWLNRAPTGYDMVNGRLVPNGDRYLIPRIFELRAHGMSYPEIERATGFKYSTVRHVVANRVYLGETRIRDRWFPGIHEPLVSADLFEAAQRGNPTGRRIGRDPLAGRVKRSGCGRVIAVETNGRGKPIYRCKHRGKGCGMPGRAASGLHKAARLALNVLAGDDELQDAIRHELGAKGHGAAPATPGRSGAVAKLRQKRQKLLDLYYADKITPTTFAEEEVKLTRQIEALEADAARAVEQVQQRHALADQFEHVATLLRDLDVDAIWNEATDTERRLLINELVEAVIIHEDRLQVAINGAPPIWVELGEVGLRGSHGMRPSVSEDRLAERRTGHVAAADVVRLDRWAVRGRLASWRCLRRAAGSRPRGRQWRT